MKSELKYLLLGYYQKKVINIKPTFQMKNRKKKFNHQTRNIKPSFTSKKLTAYAGITGINKYLRKLKLFRKFNKLFPTAMHNATQYSNAQLMMLLTLANFCKIRHLSNIETFSCDPLVMSSLNTSTKVSDSRISERFKQMGQAVSRKLEDFFLKRNKRFLRDQPLEHLTMDMDSTVSMVYGNQQGSASGYNDKKKGAKSYHPLLAFITDYKLVMHTWFRPGDAYTANGSKEFLGQVLAHVPSNIKKIFFRCDSGFFDNNLIELIQDAGHEYLIKVKFKGMYDLLRLGHWEPVEGKQDMCSYEFDYLFNITDQDGKKQKVARTLRAVRIARHHGKGYLGEDIISYDYFCYCTNIQGCTIDQVHELYKKRAESENWIEQVKNQLLGGKTLVDDFWANDIFWQLSVLTYNLSISMRLKVKRWWRQEYGTFRDWFVRVPGILVNTSNRLEIRLYRHYIFKTNWNDFYRILDG